MLDIPQKQDLTDYLPADQFNQIAQELENIITSSGIVLSGLDLNQLSKAIATYSLVADFYTDSGSANSYVLNPQNPFKAPPALRHGLKIRFRAGNNNSGASVANIAGYGNKTIKQQDGISNIAPGDISTLRDTEIRYDAILDVFILTPSDISTLALANLTGAVIPFAGSTLPSGFLACNGAAISRSSYANLFTALVTADGFSSQTFTVTIASPGVFTKSGHLFLGGERIRLSTTSALPTGLTTGTDYFVKYIDANTFQLASTLNGISINTSGSQSGTHSYLQSRYGLGDGSTTFNLPDFRDQFIRGYSSTRTLGTGQLDTFQGHGHSGVPKDGLGGPVSAFAYGGGATNAVQSLITLVSDGINGTPRSANETRPVNIALNYCIKY